VLRNERLPSCERILLAFTRATDGHTPNLPHARKGWLDDCGLPANFPRHAFGNFCVRLRPPQMFARAALVGLELVLQAFQIADAYLPVETLANQGIPADGSKGVSKGSNRFGAGILGLT